MSTSSRARVSVFRRFGWLAVALTVLMSIVGPGSPGVAAAPMPASAANAAAPDVAAACGLVPIDVELIIDHSGSMTSNSNNGHTREYWAQQAAFTLIDALQANGGVGTGAATSSGGRHRVGVTQFSGTTASVVSALASHDAAGTKALITSTGSGNTPFKTGMATGAADLTSHARATDFGLTVQHVIVFLSDGRPNPDGSATNNPPWANTSGSQRPTQSDGSTFKGSADQVFSIAVGSGGGSGSNLVDLALMQALAKPNDSAHYTNIVDSSLLPAFFSSIFQTIACPSPSPSPAPALTLVKKADPTTYSSVGATIAYTYTLKNTGNVTLSAPYSVSDDKASVSCPASPATLAPNASVDCTASYTITQADLDAGSVTNKATGHAKYGDSTVNSNQDTATVTAAQAATLSLTKAADPTTYAHVGQAIDYTYVVTNTGNVTLSGPVTVNDDKATVTCPAGDLAPAASITCTATYTITQADLDAGSVTNKATAHATFGDSTVASNQASVTVPKSDLGIVKTADTKSYSKPGDILHYTIVASNSGSATLHNVTISDPLLGTLVCLPSQPASLDAGQSMTCTGTYTVTQADVDAGKVGNTATASSTETKPVQGSAEVPATQAPAITIVKTVSLDGETYGAQVTTTPGTTVHYRIVVTNTGNLTLTGVTLSDDLVNLATVGCSIPGTLAVGQHFTCDYTLSAPAGMTVNTATADSAQTSVLNDSATVTAPAPTSIVVKKILDLDGNLATTNDRVPGAGWTFNLSGDPALQGTTNGQGIYTFDLTGLLESGTFTVSEVLKTHYTILTASCTVGEGQSRGTFDKSAASMDEVVVRAGETVTCTFVNTSGAVSPATATPRVTPPSTSTMPADGRTSDGGAWRIVLLALAALMASTLVLTTSAPKARRRR